MARLGDLNLKQLLDSADSELSGLDSYIQRNILPMIEGQPGSGNHVLFLNAYLGSIRSRVALAQGKVG